MSDYTYSLPFSNERFMKGIIMMLKKENKYDLANLLRGAKVQIEKGTYSMMAVGEETMLWLLILLFL